MKFRPLLLAACAALALPILPAARAADADAGDMRFSQSLDAGALTDTGIGRLDSDQVAALDALVRRDREAADYVYKVPRAARFSDRLTPGERQAAGLTLLSAAQLSRLDATVAARMPAPRTPISASTVAAATGGSVPDHVTSTKVNRGPEIHGEISFTMGWGSGGYSEQGGSILLDYADPEHHFDILVGYSEIHSKGGYYYRGCHDGYAFPALVR